MKNKYRDFQDINGNETLPQKLFKGTFVVFTVIALLELPNGVSTCYGNCKRDFLNLNFIPIFRHIQVSKEHTSH